jgi:hypothetical protein
MWFALSKNGAGSIVPRALERDDGLVYKLSGISVVERADNDTDKIDQDLFDLVSEL